MIVASILTELRANGAVLVPIGERLRIEAPIGVLTPELKERLRRHKVELLAFLGGEHRPSVGRYGELVIPLDCPERFQWWKATGPEILRERFRAARIAAGLPPDGVDS
jgi:hypothetical protein